MKTDTMQSATGQATTNRQLSRLLITGHIHEHTPLCVLTEIADAHGIKYEQEDYERPNFIYHMIEKIHQTPVPTVGTIKDLPEWQCVARFVNKHSQWPQGKLTQAYEFLTGFINNGDPLVKVPSDFAAGAQTPTNPFSVNACVLYKICVHCRLNINSRTTISQMANAVRMLRENPESLVRKARAYVERDAKRIDLINILLLSPHEIQDPEPPNVVSNITASIIPNSTASHEMLQILYNSLMDIRALQQKIEPSTHCGSIALAAINYAIDISKATDPTREYRILRLAGRNDYKPGDQWMQHWYQFNPIMFDLSVSFNPLFPVTYYDPSRIISMAQNEGFNANEIGQSSPYELMQLSYVTETFYLGVRPNMKSIRTPITLDEIEDVPYGELLCYGQLDSPVQLVSMGELIGLFNANQNFTNPFSTDSVFSSTSINKLKIILQTPTGPIPGRRLSPETVQIRNELLEAINGVEIMSRSNDEPTRQFAFTYRNASPDTKTVITTALINLLHIGMYMRGWSGPGNDYPVVRAPVPVEREPEVAVNVTSAIAEYDKSCRSLGKIGGQLNGLPLVIYRDGQYHVSISDHDGRTIGDRITLIKQGEHTTNMASCIRLSSNWICSSAHKYIMALGQPAPFDIFHLRQIS